MFINMRKIEYSLEDKLTFGMWKGYTIQFLIDNEYNYVSWLLENNVINLDKKAMEEFIIKEDHSDDYSDIDIYDWDD